jgi:hypothetical protein
MSLILSFILQVTWLDGHSLIQTVFICLYVHDPYIIEDPCVKVVVLTANCLTWTSKIMMNDFSHSCRHFVS